MNNQIVSIHALLAECDKRMLLCLQQTIVSIHALLAECDRARHTTLRAYRLFQSTHSLRSATFFGGQIRAVSDCFNPRTPCGVRHSSQLPQGEARSFNPRTPCGVRLAYPTDGIVFKLFQSTHSLRSATAPNLIHCYSTKQIILCANLPKKTVIARLLFLSIYLSIFYSQCITPIADLPGNSCELEVGAQAMFNSL